MVTIPPSVQKLMWEYEPDALIESGDIPDAVIERLMEHGRWEQMQWLLQTVGRPRLKRFLTERGARILPPRELSFWALACDIPESTAARWQQDARRRQKEWRG